MRKWPDYWEEAEKGNYQAVISAVNLESGAWQAEDYLRPILLGDMYLADGQFAEAARNFSLSQEMIEQTPMKGKMLLSESLGAALWLSGRKSDALGHWQRKVEAVRRRTITYVEISGGIKVGLLMYYGAVSLKEQTILLDAKKFLAKAGQRSVAERMPGPLAKVVLNMESFESVLRNTLGYNDFETCLSVSRDDILLSRELASVLLCLGTYSLEAGNELEASNWFGKIVELKNRLLEPEWYLVKREHDLRSHMG